MNRLPATLQTVYSNLVQAHLERPTFELEGSPFLRKLNNKTYWYANQRTAPGAPLKQKYLGPDTEEMRARIEQMRAKRQELSAFQNYTRGLVAQLHAAGIRGPGRKDGPILRALTNSGVFRLGGTLVGTHAFRHYDLVLGVLWKGPQRISETNDIDGASLAMAVDDTADPDIATAFAGLGLAPQLTLKGHKPTSWLLRDGSYQVDFLTPSFRDDKAPKQVSTLNMWAQGLQHLNFLIADPIDAVSPYMEGLLIRIPRPERYAVHKLIISQRRKAPDKAQKDIDQASQIIWAMADIQGDTLKAAIADADASGPKWRDALDRALALTTKAPAMHHDFDHDVVRFTGQALGREIDVLISGEALADHYGAKSSRSEDRLDAARSNRSRIEMVAQWLFRTEPSQDLLIRTADVERHERTCP